jgi:hypothetical protein
VPSPICAALTVPLAKSRSIPVSLSFASPQGQTPIWGVLRRTALLINQNSAFSSLCHLT